MAETFATSKVVTTELGRINQLAGAIAVETLPVYMAATLNAKYNVLPTVQPTDIPKIRYFGIGIKGFANVSTEKNIAQPYQPKATNMDLFEPIPFRCVRTPLDKATASQYRMVTTKKINGETYYLYYLKLLDFSSGIQLTKVTDSTSSSSTLNTANLYPTPAAINGADVDKDTTRSSASVTATRIITGAEVVEAINVMYNGDLRRARISEFGLYSGVEVDGVTSVGIDYNYTEAAYVQLASHQCLLGYDCSNVNTIIEEKCVISGGELVNL